VLPGAARNAGLRVAQGDIVSFPGSHVELPPGSLAARMRAHAGGWEMVTGTVRNGTATPTGWAAYFLDHSSVLPGRPSEELRGPPSHCSYLRHLLDAVGGFPEDRRAGEDTVVNETLYYAGFRTYRAADVELVHRNRCETPADLVRRYFTRGRAWGRILRERHPDRARTVAAEWRRLATLGILRSRGTTANVERWGGDLVEQYRHARPWVLVGIAASWTGTIVDVLAGTQRSPARAGSTENQ
jgi:hypothetical protein